MSQPPERCDCAPPTVPGAASTASTPRFRWPMRLFLGFLLFDIVFHSLAALTPYRDWLEDMGLERFPKRLPTSQELAELREKSSNQGQDAQAESPVADRVMQTLDSFWDYCKPWPDPATRRRLTTWEDRWAYGFCWLTSRLDFVEHLVGVPQRWTMFSPNAAKKTAVGRFRLLYEDGTFDDIRLICDPPDLTRYVHWFEEKILDCDIAVAKDPDARRGYCSFLAHHHGKNATGAPLKTIYFYKITYRYPSPWEDAVEVLRSQNGPPSWDAEGPSHVCEPERDRHGRWQFAVRRLNDDERQAIQRKLTRGK